MSMNFVPAASRFTASPGSMSDTCYYDETSNVCRLHVRADGLNVGEPKCFVIAGIAHHGPARDLHLQALCQVLACA